MWAEACPRTADLRNVAGSPDGHDRRGEREPRHGCAGGPDVRDLRRLFDDVQPLGGDSYVALITPFTEQVVRSQIVQISFVASVDLDWIVRIIDGIRWLEDRVA